MTKTRDKVMDRAGGARPYIERAFKDEDLRDNVRTLVTSLVRIFSGDEAALFHPAEMMGQPAAVPTDLAAQIASSKQPARRPRERVQHSVVGSRKP